MRDRPGPALSTALLLAASGASAQQDRPQSFDVAIFAGYQLNGDATLNGGELEISDSPAFGAMLDLRAARGVIVEFMYHYTRPKERFRSFLPQFSSSQTYTVAMHYIQLGVMHMRSFGPHLEPFFGATIGGAFQQPDLIPLTSGSTLDAGESLRWSLAAVAGTKIWVTPSLGIRLEARALGPIVFTQSEFFHGTGANGMVVPSGIPYLQFAFSAGLAFGW